jgi:hypothetical protein
VKTNETKWGDENERDISFVCEVCVATHGRLTYGGNAKLKMEFLPPPPPPPFKVIEGEKDLFDLSNLDQNIFLYVCKVEAFHMVLFKTRVNWHITHIFALTFQNRQ